MEAGQVLEEEDRVMVSINTMVIIMLEEGAWEHSMESIKTLSNR